MPGHVDNLGICFLPSYGMLSVLIRVHLMGGQEILKCTQNVHIQDKIGNSLITSLNICFLELSEEFSSN